MTKFDYTKGYYIYFKDLTQDKLDLLHKLISVHQTTGKEYYNKGYENDETIVGYHPKNKFGTWSGSAWIPPNQLTFGEFCDLIEQYQAPITLASNIVTISTYGINVGCTAIPHKEVRAFIEWYSKEMKEDWG